MKRRREDWNVGQCVSLARLGAGQAGVVTAVRADPELVRRLADLGLMTGAHVACRMRAPGSGPVAVELRGTVIALRASDAGGILCQLEG